ncbi:inositol monophosphatase [Cutibacterium equinum]|uniref:Inositol monophosphatase n=1 Tax=Cutibacterium equinum TaxID=3016342 RepID=A0ABY7R141_9ACTN|nr:inositol monophosphatase [Cutibacterium equinum]WCC80670.1 inositol monophosphatase [Cutibacterium equinum]
MNIDAQSVGDLIRDVAARVIDPRFRSLQDHQIHEKKPGDFVTDADRQAEEELGAALIAYAGGVVVGEEAAFADPTILDALPDADLAWVIDPIDGTRNFVRGSEDHGVMLAQLNHGETVRAWIWQPQHGHMWCAERGAGVTCDGETVRRGGSQVPIRAATTHEAYKIASPQVEWQMSKWCCAVDYPLICLGQTDVTVYQHSHPWDHLAGALMVRELGGVVRSADGVEYGPAGMAGKLVVAADEQAYRVVADLLG